MRTDWLNAKIVARTDPARTARVRIARDDGARIDFTPGQHIVVGLLEAEALSERPYSIASVPGESAVELFVALTDETGAPKNWPAVGGGVFLGTPSGQFSLQLAPPDADLIFVCTGTGIAPFASMLRTFPKRAAASLLVHGVRSEIDLVFSKALNALAGLRYLPVLSQPSAAWQGAKGRVQGWLENAAESLDPKAHVFMCGHSPMIGELKARFIAIGFPLDALHCDTY